jgi:hypothetical protein
MLEDVRRELALALTISGSIATTPSVRRSAVLCCVPVLLFLIVLRLPIDYTHRLFVCVICSSSLDRVAYSSKRPPVLGAGPRSEICLVFVCMRVESVGSFSSAFIVFFLVLLFLLDW